MKGSIVDQHIWEVIGWLAGIIGTLLTIIGAIMINKLNEVIKELKDLNTHSVKQEQEILHLNSAKEDHEKRIRQLEISR